MTSAVKEEGPQPRRYMECSTRTQFPATASEGNSREEFIQHLRALVLTEWQQFKQCASNGNILSKDDLRQKHLANRLELLKRDRPWLTAEASKLIHWFASGKDVDPATIFLS
jgi:hypothetical protein